MTAEKRISPSSRQILRGGRGRRRVVIGRAARVLPGRAARGGTVTTVPSKVNIATYRTPQKVNIATYRTPQKSILSGSRKGCAVLGEQLPEGGPQLPQVKFIFENVEIMVRSQVCLSKEGISQKIIEVLLKLNVK